MQSAKTSVSPKHHTRKNQPLFSIKPSKSTKLAIKRSIYTTSSVKQSLKTHQHAQTNTSSTSSSNSQHFLATSPISHLNITPHIILSNTFTSNTSKLHPLSKSQRSHSTTLHRQHRQPHQLQHQFNTFQSPLVSHIQKASFFSSVINAVKSTISSPTTTSSDNSTTTTTPPSSDESQFRELLNIDTQTQYKHVQEIMVGFRGFLAKRPEGENSIISPEDKSSYVQTWTQEQYQSIQMDPSSAHFFQVPRLDIPSKKKHPQGVDRIPASLSPDDPRYQEMLDNNTQRYHDGELNAKYDQRRAQMLKDSLETDVYHVDPDKLHHDVLKVTELQDKYENNPDFSPPTSESIPELRIFSNPDGSFRFESSTDPSSKTNPLPSGSDSNVTFTPKLDANGETIKVPVTGESVVIGQINDPRMLISFICDMCERRNVKSIPKRSYLRGVVLIRCECDADHLISDNLGWFDDSGQLTIERIMEQDKGEKVFKASVLDLNKPIKTAEELSAEEVNTNTVNESGELNENSHRVIKTGGGNSQLSDDHISPELYAKIQDTIRIAREQDKTQSPQFQHFYHEDKLFEQLSKQTTVPLLPPGKQHKADTNNKH